MAPAVLFRRSNQSDNSSLSNEEIIALVALFMMVIVPCTGYVLRTKIRGFLVRVRRRCKRRGTHAWAPRQHSRANRMQLRVNQRATFIYQQHHQVFPSALPRPNGGRLLFSGESSRFSMRNNDGLGDGKRGWNPWQPIVRPCRNVQI